ncbi:hypothetical protein B0H13DRAFT_1922397 [Mycena leptocephala]|nr:hypothetical protein B0H13DRAFT_1922397 [Mycena leptocephala]
MSKIQPENLAPKLSRLLLHSKSLYKSLKPWLLRLLKCRTDSLRLLFKVVQAQKELAQITAKLQKATITAHTKPNQSIMKTSFTPVKTLDSTATTVPILPPCNRMPTIVAGSFVPPVRPSSLPPPPPQTFSTLPPLQPSVPPIAQKPASPSISSPSWSIFLQISIFGGSRVKKFSKASVWSLLPPPRIIMAPNASPLSNRPSPTKPLASHSTPQFRDKDKGKSKALSPRISLRA